MSKNKKRVKWSYFRLLLAPAIFMMAFFVFGNNPVVAQPVPLDPTTPTTPTNPANPGNPEGAPESEQAETDEDGVTCAIEKIGWILCPIMEQAGRFGDMAFGFLAKQFLETEPELISNSNTGTKVAWEMARNLANIMFIIAFLVIIYSQVTGAGITNYGIKKMLPRLIIAAVAVNVSYYICQIMVDLTNIMGYEIQQFLTDAAKAVTTNTAMPISSGPSFQSGGTLTNIIIAVLALGAVVYFLGAIAGAVIGLVLITCLSIIVILLLRKAFIVLLIVVSPIAFVLYLLPNTEKYFSKWLGMFWKLLLVFPVVGLLMGSGQLASAIILAAGVSSNTTSSYSDEGGKCITLPKQSGADQDSSEAVAGECAPGAVPFMLGLTAAGIAVIPLLAVYSVLQGALSAAGAIGGKIGGSVSSWNNGRKGNFQKARQALGDERKDRRTLNALQNPGSLMGAGARRKAFRDARRNSVKQQLGRATEDAVFDRALDDDGNLTSYGQRMAGAGLLGKGADQKSQDRVVRSMQGLEQKNEQESVTALQYQYRNASSNDIEKKLDEAVKAEDEIMIRAFAEALSKRGSDGANRIAEVAAYNHGSQGLRNVINNHIDMKSKRADVDAWATKGGRLQDHQSAGVYRALSDAQLASQTSESFQHAKDKGVVDETVQFVAADGSITQVQRGAAMAASVKDMSGDNKRIASGPPPTP